MPTTDPSSPLSPTYQSPWVNPTDGKPYSPLTNLGPTPNPPAAPGFGSIFQLFATLNRPDFWIRAGLLSTGIGLVVVGIIVLVSASKTVGEVLTAAGAAAKLTPEGAAVSVASKALT